MPHYRILFGTFDNGNSAADPLDGAPVKLGIAAGYDNTRGRVLPSGEPDEPPRLTIRFARYGAGVDDIDIGRAGRCGKPCLPALLPQELRLVLIDLAS
jgi:hypothetical protein